MTSPFPGDQRPPANPEPDPALAGFPPPQPYPATPYGSQPYPNGAVAPPYVGGQLAPTYPRGPVAPLYAGGPLAPYPVAPPPVSALPTEPRPYHQLLRGPRFRWWKPVVTLLLAFAMGIPLVTLSLLPLVVMGLYTGDANLGASELDVSNLSPTAFISVNLSLIVLIPLAGLSIWIVHRIRPRYLSSVAGGIRWRWLLRCSLVVLPLWLAYMALGLVVAPPESSRPDDWLALLIIVLIMTPFQAAGEEYFFRGWIMQNIGAWFARPIVGLVVSVAVSTVVFAAAHGSPDPWILGSIGCLAVAAGIAAYRTGGLEAGIAMHAVNNLLAFGAVLTFGGWEEAFVGADTSGSPAVLVLALLVHGGALALILWQAKRHGIQSHYQPQNPSVPPAPAVPALPQPEASGYAADPSR
jgi:CAAX protease family protein